MAVTTRFPSLYVPRAKPRVGAVLDRDDPLTRGLVAAYLFNEAAGGQVFDYSGRAVNTKVSRAAQASNWETTPYGTALKFTAASLDFLGTPTYALGSADNFTLHAVVKETSFATTWTIWGGLGGTTEKRWVYAGTGVIQLRYNSGTTILAASSANTITDTKYHAITFLRRGTAGGFELYVDGVKNNLTTNSTTLAFTDAAIPRYIGQNGSGAYLDGGIACLYVFGRDLSVGEVKRLYAEPYAMFRAPAFQFWMGNTSGTAYNQTLAAISASAATVQKNPGVPLAVVSPGLATIGPRGLTRTESVVSTSSATVNKAIPRTLSALSATVATVARGPGRSLAVISTSVATLTLRALGKPLAVISASLASVQKAGARRLAVVSASSTTVGKALARSMAAVSASLAAVAGVKGSGGYTKTLAAISATTATVQRALTRPLSVVSPATATVQKALTRSLGVVTTTGAQVQRGPSRALSVASASLAAVATLKAKGVSLAAVSASTAALTRSLTRPLSVVSVVTTAVQKAIGRRVSATATSSASVVAARAYTRALAVTSAVSTTLRKATGRSLTTASASLASVGRGLGRALSAIVATLTTLIHPIQEKLPVTLTLTDSLTATATIIDFATAKAALTTATTATAALSDTATATAVLLDFPTATIGLFDEKVA